jgi:acyl carrier protein
MTQQIDSQTLRRYLTEMLNVDMAAVSDDAPLFSSGVIDSFALVSVLSFIEKSGGIRIGVGDVNLDNFDSVARIVDFVARTGR